MRRPLVLLLTLCLTGVLYADEPPPGDAPPPPAEAPPPAEKANANENENANANENANEDANANANVNAPAPEPAPAADPSRPSKKWGWAFAGAAAGSLVLGVVLGATAYSLEDRLAGDPMAPVVFDANLQAVEQRGRDLATSAYVFLATGAALAIVDAVIWYECLRKPRAAERAARLTPHGLGFRF